MFMRKAAIGLKSKKNKLIIFPLVIHGCLFFSHLFKSYKLKTVTKCFKGQTQLKTANVTVIQMSENVYIYFLAFDTNVHLF